MTIQVEEFLEHHGVVGMKWGKHKANRTESGGGSKAVAKVKAPEQKIDKVKLKAARKEIRGDVKQRLIGNKKKKGAAAAVLLIAGAPGASLAVGIATARGAGFSKGKSLAIGFLGGAPGALLVGEMHARKMAGG
jgi:hypothetical protein